MTYQEQLHFGLLFCKPKWSGAGEIPHLNMNCISVDVMTLRHLSKISDLHSPITSYFTLQSLKKHHFKHSHMEKMRSNNI